MKKFNHQVEKLTFGLLQQLESKRYSKGTLDNYRRILTNLANDMKRQGIILYSSEVGYSFADNYISAHNLLYNSQRLIRTVIGRLNDYSEEKNYSLQRKKLDVNLPENYEILLEEYLSSCILRGNRPATITKKKKFCADFMLSLQDMGCNDLKNIDASQIYETCLNVNNKDSWAIIRGFLKYLYKENLIECDYSTIIPRYTRSFVVPETYSEKEIQEFEKSIDRSSKIGIRNYAMLLLATRLGMRSGDIVRLTFDDISFESNSIHLTQEKNLQALELPLVSDIKNAIQEYIENARPVINDERCIFLRHIAPFQPITTSVLRYVTTKYFNKADIKITSKRHGPHTFRASLASSMVNDQIPYDVVRKVLGHVDPNSIKHYAKVDIERLREYSIAVPEPSFLFETFLNGGPRNESI